MTNMEMRIKTELERRFRAANTDRIVLTMKADGRPLELALCSDAPVGPTFGDPNTTLDDFDWILVYGDGPAVTMGGKPADVVGQLARYEQIVSEHAEERNRLRAFYEAHKDEGIPCCESEAYGAYSDWHKDVFGYRPHGWTYPAA